MLALCSGHMAIEWLLYMSNNLVEDISFRLITRVNYYCWNIMPTNGNIYKISPTARLGIISISAILSNTSYHLPRNELAIHCSY